MKIKKQYKTKRITKKEMEDLTKEIDVKLHEFIKQGKYKDVLISMENLGNYSLNNQIIQFLYHCQYLDFDLGTSLNINQTFIYFLFWHLLLLLLI